MFSVLKRIFRCTSFVKSKKNDKQKLNLKILFMIKNYIPFEMLRNSGIFISFLLGNIRTLPIRLLYLKILLCMISNLRTSTFIILSKPHSQETTVNLLKIKK